MPREGALAIYHAGPETVVRALLEMDAHIHALERQGPDLTARLDASEQRVKHLEAQLAKNPHNSSKPPSSDGLSKPKPKRLRPRSERPTGGQQGHPGQTLRLVEQPDRTVPPTVNQCAGCGRSLVEQAPGRIERRQVFDLPAGRQVFPSRNWRSPSTRPKSRPAAAVASTAPPFRPRSRPPCSTAPASRVGPSI